MAHRLSQRSGHKPEVVNPADAPVTQDRAKAAAGAIAGRIAGPSPERLETAGYHPCQRRRRAP